MASFREEQETWERDNLCAAAKKSSDSRRWKIEVGDSYRTEYQRDTGRILYSDAFRRLRIKTQVFSASSLNQHNRTRLAHTLEVSQIAKSIARPLRINIDLTEAIALAHDLGHTPFGHAGERALKKCLDGKTTFNHNAQSVWILQKTLCHKKDLHGNPFPGFNLTYDVVEGVWKHTSYEETINEFEGLSYLKPDQPASLEGQVVDISDGIAYLMHDVDDGIRNGLLSPKDVEFVWKQNTDLPFNNNWGHHFIYDVICYSQDKSTIDFNPHISKLYNAIKSMVIEKVIKSPKVCDMDQRGIEIVSTIFDYCFQNPEYVLKKFERRNRYFADVFGIERVIVDYIQWLGDNTAEDIYTKIKSGKSPEINTNEKYFEEDPPAIEA